MSQIDMEEENNFRRSPERDKYWLIKVTIVLILAFFYDIWPADLIPDIPIVGWGDDLFVTVLSILYAYKKKKGAS